jgi:hypothetical protein
LPGQTLIKEEFHTLIWSEPLPGGGRQVIKMYRRQPFYEPARRWLLPYRAEREYRVLSRLLRHGIACSEPLWWKRVRDARHGRCDLLATREIEEASSLELLLRREKAVPDLTPLFRLLRRMHDSGVSHGALMPRNILVSRPVDGQPGFHLIDLVRSRQFPTGIAAARIASFDLKSLLHAVGKEVSPGEAARWLAAYGLAESGTQAILAGLARHRPGRPWRHLRRMEIDVRLAAARIRRALGAPRSG